MILIQHIHLNPTKLLQYCLGDAFYGVDDIMFCFCFLAQHDDATRGLLELRDSNFPKAKS